MVHAQALLSPDGDTFSTPPTTPGPLDPPIKPSLSRKNSRPTSLQLDQHSDWKPDIILEKSSPTVRTNGSPIAHRGQVLTPKSSTSPAPPVSLAPGSYSEPIGSPCFVHSYLDKGASLTDWLRAKQHETLGIDVGVARSLQRNRTSPDHHHSAGSQSSDQPFSSPSSGESSLIESTDDDDDFGRNLTKRLAETAVGVREMSKQLGRTRVRSNIQNVLIITKARDNRLIKLTRQLALYLMLKRRPGHHRGLIVYVDNQLRKSRRFDAEGIEREHPELFTPFPRRRESSSNSATSASSNSHKEEFFQDEGQLRYWTSDMCSHSPHLFDFVITLGGDGTVLFTSWLFQRVVPPVLPFALGSLGFLTNFDFADHQAVVDSAIDSGIRVNLRMRFTCTVYRAVANKEGKGRKAMKKAETGEIMMKNLEKGGWEAVEGGWNGPSLVSEGGKPLKDKEIMCFTTRPVETFEVLNDLVVDRGPSPYVSLLELFGDEHHMTTVQADGLTVSTPTGSTAYSLSAGGSLVHPEIPAILITPICPHTLSFRPMLLPDSMELRICVPFNSRSTAWASFDGRGRVELKQGDHIKVTASKYPFPTVCADKQSTDWFHAISRTLKWNERERQKSFVVVEEEPQRSESKRKRKVATDGPTADNIGESEEDDEEDEVSEDEDKFDIDDLSSETQQPAAAEVAPESSQEFLPQIKQRLLHAAKERLNRDGKTYRMKSRSRSRGVPSNGIDSPNRYAGPQPHPVAVSPRHVEFDSSVPSPTTSVASTDSGSVDFALRGARDDIHASRKASGKSRIPVNRDLELESVKTPTASYQPYRHRGHSRSRSLEQGPRAFAVWGHDESDSNASDSDV